MKHSYEEIKLFINNLGYELISKEYINNKTNLIIKDNNEYFYYPTYTSLNYNKTPSKYNKSNPYTIQNIKLWCKINKKPFEIISNEYINSKQKLKWKCLKEDCGEIFECCWSNIYSQNQGCSYCAGMQVGKSKCLATLNPELAAEWHPTKNGDLTPYDVTVNSNKIVWWQCKENHEHEWRVSITNRNIHRSGCPYCTGRKPTKENNLLVCNPELASEWNYNKNKNKPEDYTPYSNQKVWWICKKCGHEWISVINNRNNQGQSCPVCNEPKGEKKVKEILDFYNIPYDSQYTFDDLRGVGGGLLRFDIPIFWDKEKTKLRCLIEYDGIFHYEKRYENDDSEIVQIHDGIKNKYCKDKNIKLIRIPYWKFDDIETILTNEILDKKT